MNCLYITLLASGIVQIFVKSWNQLLYARVIEDCRLPLEPRHDFFLHFVVYISPSFGEFTAPLLHILPIHNVSINSNNFRWTFAFCVEKSYDGTHLAFGGTLDRRCHFKHVSLQTKLVLPLSNEHGSQVKDQIRWQCCHNKHKKFPYWPTRAVSLLSGYASYIDFDPTASSLTTSIFPVRYFAFSGIHFPMSLVIKQAVFIDTEDCQDGLDSFSTFFDIFGTVRCTWETFRIFASILNGWRNHSTMHWNVIP